MGRIVGIDLGTTNSCIAVVEGGTATRVLSNRQGGRTTPSVVAIAEDGERLVGHIAKRQAITNPENTIFAMKRLIGRKYASPEVRSAIELHLPYSLEEAENGDVLIRSREKLYSPEEMSSILLRELKLYAEEALGEEVSQAVITVPAYFDDSERQATKDAGRIAGLEAMRIINEPTAAALAFGLDRVESSQNVAVYDLGGGTFDISILEIASGIFQVKATSGDADLGGEDFDGRIMDWLVDEFRAETGIELVEDRMAMQRLKEAAERAKAELSTDEDAVINLPFISADDNGPRHLERMLTREHFESLVADLVERTVGPCRDALEQAGLRPSEIHEVLLVGGQTRTPLVRRTVEEVFGRPPNREINPDEVVAVGAAIQGGIMDGSITDVVLLDVTPLSLGIETQGGLYTKLIERNSTIPTKTSQIFTTVVDNQETVEIHILQGERQIASENRSLGRIKLFGIPRAPKGVAQIDVTFAIDSNSIHTVSARDVTSGKEQSLQINPASGLGSSEVDRLLEEADEFARFDDDRRTVRRLRNRLRGLIETNEKVFEQFSGMFESGDQAEVRSILHRATVALHSESRRELEEAMVDLSSVSGKLSEMLLNASAAH